MLDIVTTLYAAIKAGKIRHWGLSNETSWGISQYLAICNEYGLAKPISIQNEFNLLHTKDWPYVIESCVHENIAYLPWSPLAGGALSGKYLNQARPQGSRWTMLQRNGLFRNTPQSEAAVAGLVAIAHKHQLSPVQLALAWCDQVDGVSSTIIGATTLAQLEEDIAAFDLVLSDAVLEDVNQALKQFPMPF